MIDKIGAYGKKMNRASQPGQKMWSSQAHNTNAAHKQAGKVEHLFAKHNTETAGQVANATSQQPTSGSTLDIVA